MTLMWAIVAVSAALILAVGLYRYFTDSPEIDGEEEGALGGETPEERAAAIARRHALIEEEKRKERERQYSDQ